MNKAVWHKTLPALGYTLLAALVLLPLLKPGFVLTLDLVFTPHLPMPAEVNNEYLFHLLLHVLSLVVPGDVIEKLLLLSILVGSGLGAHRLTAYLQGAADKGEILWPLIGGRFLAGTLYMINPFTYSRFMAGQYLVLLGYMLLPFFTAALLRFLQKPGWRGSLQLAGIMSVMGIISIHTLGLMALIGGLGALVYACSYRQQRDQLIKLLRLGGLSLLVFVATSSYWLGPLLLNRGSTAQAIGQFTTGDQQAFATLGEGLGSKLFNIVRLQGFWAEARPLYAPADQRLPGSSAAISMLWVLVIVGGIVLWRRGQWAATILLGGAAGLAALMAALDIGPWLTTHLPLWAGYREPHKFVMLVALAFAVFAGQGGTAILRYVQKRFQPIWIGVATGALALIPLLLTPTMFWGFGGQLAARHYPDDWQAMNKLLNRDAANFNVLFLPWHLYMHYGFAGRIIASPADKFFDKPILSSNELEFRDASPAKPNAQKKQLGELLSTAEQGTRLGAQLQTFGIKYILLAKAADYRSYTYLNDQTDLQLLRDGATLRLYKNQAFEKR